jgi:PKD repeat protein
MKKIFLITTALALTASLGKAQRDCGTMLHKAQEELMDPKSAQRRMDIEAFTQDFEQQLQGARTSVVYNIPVVFHVVYNGATQNIPDLRLTEQLDVLNKDFRKQNTDINLVPAAWQGIAADCEINFCLATLDPSGNPTTGITRTSTSSSGFSTNDMVKYTAQGGINAWPRDLYLNIWVCNLSGGLLGYAQFPGGAAATDGVVLDYAYTGKTGASAPFNKGRTGTHEVGHWFNLYHIWGDDGNACSGSDQVTDTPNQAGENYNCPSGVLTDACTGSAPGIMYSNYMDYTDDACMFFFTTGQKARVQATMAGPRAALATSNRCNGTTTVAAAFTSNVTTGCAPLTVNFTDQSFGTPTSWSWTFGGGGTPNTSTQQNPTIVFNTPGTYTVTLVASNGTSNDTETLTSYITVTGTVTGTPLPFTETFETGVFTTNNWSLRNPDASTTWEIVTTAGTTPGSKSARVDFYNYATIGQRDGMVTKSLNLSGLSSATMTFDHAYKRYYTSSRSDSLIVYVSTNSCADTWTRVLTRGENGTQTMATTTGTGGNQFVPSGSSQWCAASGNAPCYTVSLTPYIGNPDVRVKFEGYNDYGNNLYIDNINIVGVIGAAAPVANFSANNTAVCAGQTVAFTDQSSNSPTSWSWNFGGGGTPNTSTQQSPTITFNTPGTYNVTLTATNGTGSDQEIRTGYILVRPRPTASGVQTPTTCGLNNGGVTLTTTGGTPGYTYLWSNSSTSANLSNVGTGTYTVTVTDVNGCTGTASSTVSATAQPTGNIQSVVHTTCGQSNGSANVTASSGTPGYTYLWSTGATTATASNLPAGGHSVTVTDAAGCTFVRTTTINASSGPVATISGTTQSGCGQSNGSATVTATGGTTYTYLWSNGATTATASNLAAGNYTVTVTSSGCTTTAVATVSNSGAPTATLPSIQHTTCGQTNGSATVSATGGGGGYTYLWSNGATTPTISNVAGGTYTVTVTSQTNCSTVATAVINSSTQPVATVSGQNTTCGNNNGSATANASAGAGNYSYTWSNGGTTATVNGLAPGSYTVTVTDGAGCTVTGSANIVGSPSISVSLASSTNPPCGFNTGTATAQASGGFGAISYLWSNGQSGAISSNMAAGTYTVTATDAQGCTATTSVVIQNGAGPSVTVPQVTNLNCAGDQNGVATVVGSGGTTPYTYLWSDGQTTASANALAAGTYSVTVTDAGGCTAVAQATITEPIAVGGTTTSTPESSTGASNGTASVNPSGGTAPYTYMWTNGQTTQTSTGLSVGTYNVTVTDANGCVYVTGAQVGLLTGVADAHGISLEIFPNPNNGSFSVQFSLPELSDVQVIVHNMLGQVIWRNEKGAQMEGRIEILLPSVAEGIYHVELQAGSLRTVKKVIIRN